MKVRSGVDIPSSYRGRVRRVRLAAPQWCAIRVQKGSGGCAIRRLERLRLVKNHRNHRAISQRWPYLLSILARARASMAVAPPATKLNGHGASGLSTGNTKRRYHTGLFSGGSLRSHPPPGSRHPPSGQWRAKPLFRVWGSIAMTTPKAIPHRARAQASTLIFRSQIEGVPFSNQKEKAAPQF